MRANKQKNRLTLSKARLNSINMQLQHQLAMYKVTGSMQKSTEIMKLSNQLIKLPEVSKVMREMSMEMTKVRTLVLLKLHRPDYLPSSDLFPLVNPTFTLPGWYYGGNDGRHS